MQHRDTTKRNYYAIWKVFNEFFIRLDEKPDTWQDRLTLFVGYLIQKERQSSTVKSYVSAIKAVLKENNIHITSDQYLLASLIRACRIKNDRIRTRLPIRKKMLAVILKKTKEYFYSINQPYLACLYQTLFLTTYYGLFRVGEMTTGDHPVLAKDVQVGVNKKKFLFILRSSKTHGYNSYPQMVKITSTSNAGNKKVNLLPCPYTLLLKYSRMRGNYYRNSDPFFTFADGSPVTARQMSSCLKLMIKKAGFNEKLYGTHSLRAGRTNDLYKLGLSVETIKKLGRWRSNAVFRYLRG